MGDDLRVWHLAQEFRAQTENGQRPDPRDFLRRAGPDSEPLAALLEEIIWSRPPAGHDESTACVLHARVVGRNPYEALRERRGLDLDQFAQALANDLEIDRTKTVILKAFVVALERGEIRQAGLHDSLIVGIASALDASPEAIKLALAQCAAHPKIQLQPHNRATPPLRGLYESRWWE